MAQANIEEFNKSIAKKLENVLSEFKEDYIKNSVAKFEKDLRSEMAKRAINIADYVDYKANSFGVSIFIRKQND